VVVCISKSGNTEEILRLIPLFKRQGVPIIAMTGGLNSSLSQQSDATLDVSVSEEACPFDLVPTSSTTATLVMGDALAVALIQNRKFSVEDFAALHPAGDIGRRFFMRIDDVMRTGEDVARVNVDTPLAQVILTITSKRLGATCVLNGKGKLKGIITDGDLRRLIEHCQDMRNLVARDVMTSRPKCVAAGVLAAEALRMMEEYSINQLIVLDRKKNPVGMVHIHDLLKAGLA